MRQDLVRHLYLLDAQGIYDDVLIDEVGYALFSRCKSFIQATEAVQGRARCPVCDRIVLHSCDKDGILHCECGWSLPWADYFATIQHKQLSGAEPVVQLFQDYVHRFPAARTLLGKVLLIDRLLHGFHRARQHGKGSHDPYARNAHPRDCAPSHPAFCDGGLVRRSPSARY